MFTLKRNKIQRGQSFVELSLCLVVLILLLSGLLDLGRMYFIFIALEDGAGEAALFLSINPECPCAPDDTACYSRSNITSVPASCADPNNADYRARHAGGEVVDWQGANITIKTTEPYGVGDPVEVSIDYTFPLLTPIIPKIVGVNPMTLRAEASQIILTEKS